MSTAELILSAALIGSMIVETALVLAFAQRLRAVESRRDELDRQVRIAALLNAGLRRQLRRYKREGH